MVFVCAGIYFIAFLMLRRRLAGAGRARALRYSRLPGDVFLVAFVAVAALAYALGYTEAVKSTPALTLTGGAMLGQAAALWAGRRRIANSQWQMANAAGEIVLALIILLAGAAVWQGERGHFFQYRGQARWSGPWDNPNTFGVLMGVGVVLALANGRRLRKKSGKAEGRMKNAEGKANIQHPTSNIEHRTSNLRLWLTGAFFLGAAGVMGGGVAEELQPGGVGGDGGGTALAEYLELKC